MTALTLLAAISIGAVDQPRLARTYENGAKLWAASMPDANTVSAHLIFSSRGTDERRSTHGYRHLLEHLIARGTDRSIDTRLESEGLFLRAETYRDAMVFRIDAPAKQLNSVKAAFKNLLQRPTFNDEDFAREVRIMQHEQALVGVPRSFSNALWAEAYGEAGLDSFGNLEVMKNATAENLQRTWRRMTASSNVLISIAGNAPIKDLEAFGKDILQGLPPTPASAEPPAANNESIEFGTSGPGAAFGLPVDSLDERETLAALAVGLAVYATEQNAQLIYTPSGREGLMTLFVPTSSSAESFMTRPLSEFRNPKSVAIQYWQSLIASPDRAAFTRGILMAQGCETSLESLLRGTEGLTQAELDAAWLKWRSKSVRRGF